MAGKRPKNIDDVYIAKAEKTISDYSRTVNFTIVEYSFEFIVEKLNKGRYYVPGYQRELVWTPEKQSRFIESVLMGLPIPFVFFWQDEQGKMEIVDGSQRLRTINSFMSDGFALKNLKVLTEANGLLFSDFSESLRYKFSEKAIRVIVLDNSTDAVTRTEMFARINTGGTFANEAEIRRGSLPGPFMDLIISLAESKQFVELTPISKNLVNSREREELVTRFFAYLEGFDPSLNDGAGDIPEYKEKPRVFYFRFVEEMNNKIASELEISGESQILGSMESEFKRMLTFVKSTSPNGFTKSATGNQVPRVRFEAIAVGIALALRERESLVNTCSSISEALESTEFDYATKSDAANVKSKLMTRVTLIRDWLLS